jgi:hypothetical protein
MATSESSLTFDFKDMCPIRVMTTGSKIQYLKLSLLHTLIYPGWVPALYQFKPNSLVFTPRDTWFFNLLQSESARHAWSTGLQQRYQLTKDFLKQNPNRDASNFTVWVSDLYNLGK